ncbi:hypothetical protein DXG03_002092 [Asterophora parasitica]|uniref:Kinase n=1 Tax=Asterophora parasitica TaxID=117018 RepID=A0A9P7K9Z7_9AGAR|nr:hypothetical protein DXG03_002092 [Asterophora parasitica]
MESSIATAKPLSSQVGGHAGVLTTEDGSLIIKPVLPLELQFYQAVQQDINLAPLQPFIPKFLGTLRLEGQLDEAKSTESGNITLASVEIAPQKDDKPNILDVKLGTILYDESAPPDKVYDNKTSEAVNTPKSYGKSIRPVDLPDGIARFFPVGGPLTEDGGAVSGASPSGLPLQTLQPILQGIREEIVEIRDAFSEVEVTMVGGSLLIVYEADWTRAEAGIQKLLEDDEELEDGDDEDEDDEDEGDEGNKRLGVPFSVKLIDFAHTRLVPGKGPDQGVLLGINTVLKLIDGRISELEKLE